MLAEVGYKTTVWVSSHVGRGGLSDNCVVSSHVSRGGLSDKSRSKFRIHQLLVLRELCKFVHNLSGGGPQTMG